MGDVEVPRVDKLAWPVLESVGDLGGSASIGEIVDAVIRRQGFTDEQQALMHGGGPQTELAYRLGWARTALKATGFLTNSSRGIWSLSNAATGLLNDPSLTIEQRGERVNGLIAEYRVGLRAVRRGRDAQETVGVVDEPNDDGLETPSRETDWKQQLLENLLGMQPDAFERLASRLLREAGIDNVVTGKTGDGGIDGRGFFRVGLVGFPVVFQCKRYQGSVGSSTVRDFRGAMSGRTDKGLIVTTGTFTAEAKKEAAREGVPPIDLIDGDALCDELKKYGLGVQTQQVETVTVIGSFFSDI